MVEFQGRGVGVGGGSVSPAIQQPSCVAGVKLTQRKLEIQVAQIHVCLLLITVSLRTGAVPSVCFPSARYRELAQCMGGKTPTLGFT